MTKEKAIAELPLYAEERMPKPSMTHRAKMFDKKRFVRKYGIVFGVAIFFTLYTILLSAWVNYKAEKRVWEEAAVKYDQEFADYLNEQKLEQSKQYFLSGDASRDAFIDKEIDSAARLASKMDNDVQKGGIICNAIARVMSPQYPSTIEAVVAQEGQWMFYSPDNKFTEHDREIAEKIVRAYYDGIIPNGLTEDYIYGSWSPSDYVLRNTWEFGQNTRTWRYQG